MECDSFLKNLKEKLVGFSESGLGNFVSESDNEFSNIEHALASINDVSLVWKDAVGSSLTSIIEGAKASVERCKLFPKNVIEPVAGLISPLNENINLYVKLVDDYNELEKEWNNISVGYEPSKDSYEDEDTYKKAHDAWSSRKQQKSSKKTDLETKFKEVETVKEECYSSFNNINGILGSSTVLEAPSEDFNSFFVKNIEEQLEDGKKRIIVQEYDEDGNIEKEYYKVVDSDGITSEQGTVYYHSKGKTVNYNKYYVNDKGEYYTLEKNITDEYDVNNKILLRKIEQRKYNGTDQSGITITFDDDGNDAILDIKEITKQDGSKLYDAHRIIGENTMNVLKVEKTDGTVENKVLITYDENEIEVLYDVEETVKQDGTKMYNSHKDINKNIVSIEKVLYPDGTKEHSVYEKYTTVSKEDGQVIETLKNRTVKFKETTDNKLTYSIKEEYDENGNLIESTNERVENLKGRDSIEVMKEIEEQKKEESRRLLEKNKIDQEYADRITDLNNEYDKLGSIYTEEGKKEHMLDYIRETSKDLPEGVTYEDIYNSWVNNTNSTGKDLGTIPSNSQSGFSFEAAHPSVSQKVANPTDLEGIEAESPVLNQTYNADEAIPSVSKEQLRDIQQSDLYNLNGQVVRGKDGEEYTLYLDGYNVNVYKDGSAVPVETVTPLDLVTNNDYFIPVDSSNPTPAPNPAPEISATPTPPPSSDQSVESNITQSQQRDSGLPAIDYKTDTKYTPQSSNPTTNNDINNMGQGDTITVIDKLGGTSEITLVGDNYRVQDEDGNIKTITRNDLLNSGDYYNLNTSNVDEANEMSIQDIVSNINNIASDVSNGNASESPVLNQTYNVDEAIPSVSKEQLRDIQQSDLYNLNGQVVRDKDGEEYTLYLDGYNVNVYKDGSAVPVETVTPLDLVTNNDYFIPVDSSNPTPAPNPAPEISATPTPPPSSDQSVESNVTQSQQRDSGLPAIDYKTDTKYTPQSSNPITNEATSEENPFVNNFGNLRKREKKIVDGPAVEIKAEPIDNQ